MAEISRDFTRSRTEFLVGIGEGSLGFSEERGFLSVGTGEENEKGNSHLVRGLSWEGLQRDWHLDPQLNVPLLAL